MILKFLGTKGYIDISSKRHKMHTSLLILHKNKKFMIDCGEGWERKLKKINPDYIIITHAHPDHAFGLKNGTKAKVLATKKSFDILKKFPLKDSQKKVLDIEKKIRISTLTIEPFSLIHSIKAPAIGIKVTYLKKSFFYAPDVLWIENREKAFKDILFYIGDGATINKSLVRKDKKTNKLFGHANISQQLTWCRKENVKKMIVTHLGSQIVKDEKKAKQTILKLANEKEVEVLIAYDSLEIKL